MTGQSELRMSLVPGSRLGPYEIVAPLGAGGMGEVYRARDSRLKREVAIKVLPDGFAADPDRIARFRREAELLATLNHPNIAQIYGLEESPADAPGHTTLALVMELVEGPTLADALTSGAAPGRGLPLDEVLDIAGQLADALAAAHERGIVHRDLKPANIKLDSAGKLKVLDFGLARLHAPHASDEHHALSQSPTMKHPAQMTGAGMILGTAGYMSPEQARAKPVDQRSDIWAFGCVIFELLAGRAPFDGGETPSDTIAAILTGDPDWNALPADTPPAMRRLLRRCLEKDPARRLHHVADARLDLEDSTAMQAEPAAGQRTGTRAGWKHALPWAAAAFALAGMVLSWDRGGPATVVEPVQRLELNLPEGVELVPASSRTIALSPDGTKLAFVGTVAGNRYVYLRPLDEFEATPLHGSDGAGSCLFSADGRSIAFVGSGGLLKTISLDDGLVVTAAEQASERHGAVWLPNDHIVFVRGGAIWQVPAAGGTPEALTSLNGDETLHAWPATLPSGKAILFSAFAGTESRIDALVLQTGQRRTIVERGTLPMYAASGHLMYFRDGELFAAPFDPDRMEVTGRAVPAIAGLRASAAGTPVVDLALSGTVVYVPSTAVSRLVYVTRDGVEQSMNDTPRAYASPRVSPDGTRLLVQSGAELWIQDIARATFTRLTPPGLNVPSAFPVWTPDGSQVVLRGPDGLRLQDAGGGGQHLRLAGTAMYDYPGAFTPDGQTLVFVRSTQTTSSDIYSLPLADPAQARPLVPVTATYESGARLSPDGRWLAYVSNESGRNEVYLRPYSGPDRKWQLSTDGGTQPVWNPAGGEIFYRSGDRMMSIAFVADPELSLSPPRLLFEQPYAYGPGRSLANYDVTPDGQRFIMVKDEWNAGRLHVVLNWFSELSRRAPAR